MYRNNTRTALPVFVLILISLACNLGGGGAPDATPPAVATPPPTITPDFEPTAVVEPTAQISSGTLRQWGISATASSEYTTSGWSAMQATGAPDVYPDCGDISGAWATDGYGRVDWIEITYGTAVVPEEIKIYETFNPGHVIKVDVVDEAGTAHTVYESAPKALKDCGSVLSVFPDLTVRVSRVVVYIDTTLLNNWTEIDAVELVGKP